MVISRQKAVLTAALSLAVGISPTGARADISTIIDDEKLIFTLHTHLYSSSKGLPSSDEFQTAAVCFISDTSDCSDYKTNEKNPDYNLNDAERCRKEGYGLSSCAEGEIPEGFCIYNSNYFARCVCPSGYKTCEAPYYGVGAACGNKYASCAEDTERACKELNSEFTNTCQDGWKINPNNTCKYDTDYGTCCNLCSGYDYTTIPEGYVQDGDTCTDCNGTVKYKIKINPCEGFQDCGSMGGDAGAKTCMSGSQIKYDNCKPCPNQGTLSSCPTGSVCQLEECSGLLYVTGCKSGYTNFCTKPTTNCTALGYKKTACSGKTLKCPYNSAYVLCL